MGTLLDADVCAVGADHSAGMVRHRSPRARAFRRRPPPWSAGAGQERGEAEVLGAHRRRLTRILGDDGDHDGEDRHCAGDQVGIAELPAGDRRSPRRRRPHRRAEPRRDATPPRAPPAVRPGRCCWPTRAGRRRASSGHAATVSASPPWRRRVARGSRAPPPPAREARRGRRRGGRRASQHLRGHAGSPPRRHRRAWRVHLPDGAQRGRSWGGRSGAAPTVPVGRRSPPRALNRGVTSSSGGSSRRGRPTTRAPLPVRR